MTPKNKIACICPTYKRPDHLKNAIACFHHQDYPTELCKLFILDDAGIYESGESEEFNFNLVSTAKRFDNLPLKYNALLRLAELWGADAFAVWEDDEVFFPHHLSNIDSALQWGQHFITPEKVWGNYGEEKGDLHIEGAEGRFHSSWAFSQHAYEKIGKSYPKTGLLSFDQQLGAQLRGLFPDHKYMKADPPSFVYRWGNGIYHGSQGGESGYKSLWETIGKMEIDKQDFPVSEFDEETSILFRKYMNRIV